MAKRRVQVREMQVLNHHGSFYGDRLMLFRNKSAGGDDSSGKLPRAMPFAAEVPRIGWGTDQQPGGAQSDEQSVESSFSKSSTLGSSRRRGPLGALTTRRYPLVMNDVLLKEIASLNRDESPPYATARARPRRAACRTATTTTGRTAPRARTRRTSRAPAASGRGCRSSTGCRSRRSAT